MADVEFDECNGQIRALIIPAPVHFFSCFGKCLRYCIRFCDVVRIGPDIILVDVNLEKALMKDD